MFKRVGGEDVALSLAVLSSTQMGTVFENVGMNNISVIHYLDGNNHAYRLLDQILFDKSIENIAIQPKDHEYANQVTQNIINNLCKLNNLLMVEPRGKVPLKIEY